MRSGAMLPKPIKTIEIKAAANCICNDDNYLCQLTRRKGEYLRCSDDIPAECPLREKNIILVLVDDKQH